MCAKLLDGSGEPSAPERREAGVPKSSVHVRENMGVSAECDTRRSEFWLALCPMDCLQPLVANSEVELGTEGGLLGDYGPEGFPVSLRALPVCSFVAEEG